MKNKIFLLALLQFNLYAQKEPGKYKGWHVLSKEISHKIFSSQFDFDLINYLGNDESLGRFFGQYIGSGKNLKFENGTPNANNFFLYYTSLTQLSNSLKNVCNNKDVIVVSFRDKSEKIKKKQLKISSQFIKKVSPFCIKSKNLRRVKKKIRELWTYMTDYSANGEIYKSYEQYILSTDDKYFETTLSSLFLNPYFLLQR